MTAPVSLPASCEVEALAQAIRVAALDTNHAQAFRIPWADIGPDQRGAWMAAARMVRSLVEAKVREALLLNQSSTMTMEPIVSRVLGVSP